MLDILTTDTFHTLLDTGTLQYITELNEKVRSRMGKGLSAPLSAGLKDEMKDRNKGRG